MGSIQGMILAQAAAPIVIDNGVSFALPVVIILLGFAAALAEARWRVIQVEKQNEKLEKKQEEQAEKQAATDAKVGTQTEILKRLEAHLVELKTDVHSALRKSA